MEDITQDWYLLSTPSLFPALGPGRSFVTGALNSTKYLSCSCGALGRGRTQLVPSHVWSVGQAVVQDASDLGWECISRVLGEQRPVLPVRVCCSWERKLSKKTPSPQTTHQSVSTRHLLGLTSQCWVLGLGLCLPPRTEGQGWITRSSARQDPDPHFTDKETEVREID